MFLALTLVFIRLWLATLRVRVIDLRGAPSDGPTPRDGGSGRAVLAFFHGDHLPLMRLPWPGPMTVLLPKGARGSWTEAWMAARGLFLVYGPNHRDAGQGLRALARAARTRPTDVAMAVDGPRGPRGIVRPGIPTLARWIGADILPVAVAVHPFWRLDKLWDHRVLPWPFARVVIVVGPALPSSASPVEVGNAIRAAAHRAEIEAR